MNEDELLSWRTVLLEVCVTADENRSREVVTSNPTDQKCQESQAKDDLKNRDSKESFVIYSPLSLVTMGQTKKGH